MSLHQPRILIIGAGLTGSLCAYYIRNQNSNFVVDVLDKARGAGGRMTTSRNDTGNRADIGAQYITVNNKASPSEEYQLLLKDHILQPLSASIVGMKSQSADVENYIASEGTSTIVKFFLSHSQANVTFNQHVSKITKQNNEYNVETVDGDTNAYDIVVSTMPIPQFLALKDVNLLINSKEVLEKLQRVKYSTRFALMWYFDDNKSLSDVDWCSQYFDHDVIRFVTIDNIKRNQLNEPTTVVFHTTTTWGEQNRNMKKEDAEAVLLHHVKTLFPDWPQPRCIKCHKWLYSQVVLPYSSQESCLILNNSPTLILAGDAFAQSNMDGCIKSAQAAANAVKDILQSPTHLEYKN